jgi:hypothetical protein
MERTMSHGDRDPETGRFAPGWHGGPGRPRRAIEADYLAALSEAVPLESWNAVIAKALEQAQNGDAKAREWLSGYLLPKPGEGSPLADMAAADFLDFDSHEFDILKMGDRIRNAQAILQVGQNIDEARKAGVLKPGSSLTDILRVALGMAPVN